MAYSYDAALSRFSVAFFLLAIVYGIHPALSQSVDSTLAKKFYDLGVEKSSGGEYEKANVLLFKSSAINKKLNLKDSYIKCQYTITWNFKNLGLFTDGEKTALAAITFVKQNKLDPFLIRKFCRLIGEMKSQIGDYKEAEKYFLIARGNAELKTTLDSTFLGLVYNDMGNLFSRTHALEDAIDHYYRAINMGGRKADMLTSKGNIGLTYSDLGNYSKAIAVLNEVIDEEIKLYGEDSHRLINHYVNIGRCFYDLGDSYTACEYFEKSLALSSSNRTNPLVAKILHNIGLTYFEREDYKKARIYFDSAIYLDRKSFKEDYPAFALSYNALGESEEQQGNFVSAMEYFSRGLKNGMVNNDTFMIIRSHNKIAHMKMQQKKYDDAMIILNNAIKLSHAYRHPSEVYLTRQYIAYIYSKAKDFSRAIDMINAGIRECTPGMKLNEEYDSTKAEVFANHQLLSLICDKGSYQKHLAELKTDVQLSLQALATFEWGVTLIDHLDITYSDEQSKLNLRKQFLSLYENAIGLSYDLFIKTKDKKFAEKAFYFSEKNKATQLRHFLRHEYAMKFSGIPDSLIARENDLRSLVRYYQQRVREEVMVDHSTTQDKLFNLSNQHARLLELFKNRYPRFYELKYKSHVATPGDIQHKLYNDNTTMVKYFGGDSTFYAFVVTKYDFQLFKLSSSAHIDRLSENFIKAIKEQDYKSYGYNAFQLYSELIKPLKIPQATDRIIIIPDGKLHYVPFEALVRTLPANAVNAKSFAYLVRDYSFQYHVSATLMVESLSYNELRPDKKFAAFAPIEFSPLLKIPALFGSEQEVKNAAQRMNGDCLVRDQATESAFKNSAGSYAIIHLATHAIIDNRDPLKSKLLFSAATDSLNDGILHNYELYNLQLQADLVTLSACNTGAGKLEEGEGVMSLARAFMYAGSQSLLMSLWPASDNASQLVMKYFYEELADGKTKTKALQLAKIRYLDQADDLSADPFLWSNFVLVGDEKVPPRSNFFVWISISLVALLIAYYIRRKNNIKLFGR
jgi:CHAT domain-containing protein/Tfp pilus assembly protein PilF